MTKSNRRMSRVDASRPGWGKSVVHQPPNLPVKLLTVVFIISVLITACSGSAVIQPGMLEGSTGMSSSLRSEQEIPKSGGDGETSSSEGNSSPKKGNGEEVSNDPKPVPEKPDKEPKDAPTASIPPEATPTTVPTETAVEPPSQPPAQPSIDLSIPVGPKIGNRAPDFALQTLDGNTIALPDLLGKPLVINYWATWCVPCKAELPILEKLFQEYQSRGLMIVSVDAIEQDTSDKLQSVITQTGMTFPTLLDAGNRFAEAYQAIFFPTSFFIDANGVIRDVTLGDSSEEIFRQKIERLLSGEF